LVARSLEQGRDVHTFNIGRIARLALLNGCCFWSDRVRRKLQSAKSHLGQSRMKPKSFATRCSACGGDLLKCECCDPRRGF
jgi:hypothetical protein